MLKFCARQYLAHKVAAIAICNSEDFGKVSALFPFQVLSEMPEPGESWQILGVYSLHPSYGPQLRCQSACRVEVTGEQIVRFLAKHRQFKGVGEKTANKLWQAFGEELPALLDNRDVGRLKSVIGTKAFTVLAQWHLYRDELKVQWFLQKYGVSSSQAADVYKFYRQETIDKLLNDPYRLTAFVSWKVAEAFAKAVKVKDNDERRLVGAVQWLLSCAYQDGHTAQPKTDLISEIRSLLECGDEQAERALSLAEGKGVVCPLQGQDDVYQSSGVQHMEAWVADELNRLSLFMDSNCGDGLDKTLAQYESDHSMSLSKQQREAVKTALDSRLTVISGGAGSGKTTVLKAVYECLAGANITQLALTGRATLRMTEATGQPAYTIAYFLMGDSEQQQLFNTDVLVIDEASMVDIATMYSVLKRLPDNCKLILVGDHKQLPPVGPGMVFHKLLNTKLPSVNLVQNHRSKSAVAEFSMALRAGRWIDASEYINQKNGVFFLPASRNQLVEKTVNLFMQDKQAQIVSPLRRGQLGAEAINALCHLNCRNSNMPSISGLDFCVGEPVVFTQNDWSRNLSNGSLGTVKAVYSFPVREVSEGRLVENILALVDFDGRDVPITMEDIAHKRLEHAYAISVHRAQGSEFCSVIVPIVPSRVLDSPMLYTAVTRAKERVILVGDIEETKRIVTEGVVHERFVGFSV